MKRGGCYAFMERSIFDEIINIDLFLIIKNKNLRGVHERSIDSWRGMSASGSNSASDWLRRVTCLVISQAEFPRQLEAERRIGFFPLIIWNNPTSARLSSFQIHPGLAWATRGAPQGNCRPVAVLNIWHRGGERTGVKKKMGFLHGLSLSRALSPTVWARAMYPRASVGKKISSAITLLCHITALVDDFLNPTGRCDRYFSSKGSLTHSCLSPPTLPPLFAY